METKRRHKLKQVIRKSRRWMAAVGQPETEIAIGDFLEACEFGDAPMVERVLTERPDFNIDMVDEMGRSALRLAVENEHLSIVEILIHRTNSAHMKEALLLAIYLGHVQIAEFILRHPKYKLISDKKFGAGSTDSFWQSATSDDAQFPSDITPLVLASQYNRYPIVRMLLSRGEKVAHPHDYYCKCKECHNKFKFDSLRHAQARLNAYKALASESYLALESIDPIYNAFELGHELRKLSRTEKYFQHEYSILADQLSKFVVKLLDKCRGHDELEIILNKTGKPNQEKYEKLARLSLALKYEEKQFVAHPWCQQKLVEIWFSHIRKIEKMNRYASFFIMLLYIVILPLMSIIYVVAPTTKVGVIYRQPFVKFIGHSISYFTFLTMIVVVSLVQERGTQKNLFNETYEIPFQNYSAALSAFGDEITFGPENEQLPNVVLRSASPLWLEYVITVFIVGFAWKEVRQFISDGIYDYFESFFNVLDMLMLGIYMVSYAMRFYALSQVKQSLSLIQSEEFWLKNDSKLIKNTIYWVNNDRYYWDQYDPINLAEGLFAIANVLSFTRISYLLPASQQLGPLQISLGRMLGDIAKFCVIFLILLSAFMIGLNNLYWYYAYRVRSKTSVEDHATTNAENNFGNMNAAFQSVFWQLFGIGSSGSVLLDPYQNSFTETIGYCLFGAYSIVAIVVLLNMLIAMMSKSFEAIQEEADVEWKFARSRLYMEYIKEGSSLSVPFNLLPTWKSFVYGIPRFFRERMNKLCRPCSKKRDEETPQDLIARTKELASHGPVRMDPGDKLTYHVVTSRIVKRFILQEQREMPDDATEADFEELKQDLSSFRFDVREDIDNNTNQITALIKTLSKLNTCVLKLEDTFAHIQKTLPQVQADAQSDEHVQVPLDGDNDVARTTTAMEERAIDEAANDLLVTTAPSEFYNIFTATVNHARQAGSVKNGTPTEIIDN